MNVTFWVKGAISPLLANIFLHFAFDKWIEREYPKTPFERYADDIIVHARSEKEAEVVLKRIKERFHSCKLELHPIKTKIVHCPSLKRRKLKVVKHQQFDFLGFTFRPRKVVTKKGKVTMGFLPAISKTSTKRIVMVLRKLKVSKWIGKNIEYLSLKLSPLIRGWLQYYSSVSKYGLSTLFVRINNRLVKWVYRKYKRFKRTKSFYRAKLWLRQISHQNENLFPHWQMGFKP